MSTNATAAPNATSPATPKYAITGNTLEEMALSFAELVIKTGSVEVKDTKSGNSKYAIWALSDGVSTNPFDKGMNLGSDQALKLQTPMGAPLKLSVELVYRKLTPVAQLASLAKPASELRAASITSLKAKLAELEAKGR